MPSNRPTAASAALRATPVLITSSMVPRTWVPTPACNNVNAIKTAALAAPSVVPHLEGKQVVKVIVAGGKLVSVVVK